MLAQGLLLAQGLRFGRLPKSFQCFYLLHHLLGVSPNIIPLSQLLLHFFNPGFALATIE